MKAYIAVIQSHMSLPNWQVLANPEKHHLIVFANAKAFAALSEQDKACITTIHMTEDFSYDALCSLIEKHIKPNYGEFLISTVHEFLLLTIAKVREHFNIPGDRAKDIVCFRDKVLMKQQLKDLDCLPRYVKFDCNEFKKDENEYFNKILSKLSFPLFVKPTAEGGSLGTSKISDREELLNWARNFENKEDYEIDEFVEGELYHCDSVIKDRKILYAGIGKYLFPNHQFLNGKPLASIFLSETDPDFLELQSFNQKVISAFDYVPNGVTHLEVFKTVQGKFIFLEVAVRPPGGMIFEMYKEYVGLHYPTINYVLQFGIEFNLTLKKGPYPCYAQFPFRKGVVSKINEPEHLKSKYTFTPRVKVGQELQNARYLLDVASEVFFWNDNYSELEADFLSLSDYPALELE